MNEKNIQESFLSSSNLISNSVNLSKQIEDAINLIVDCLKTNGKIILFGNGGSAADAQHIAAELIGKFNLERESFPAIALTTDSSIITSLSNDYSYDIVFSRQCEGLVNQNDVVIGISTSGNSVNVKNGLITSKKLGATTIGLLGNNGGSIKQVVDLSINVNSHETSKIQEVHRVIYHIICDMVERQLSKK